MSQANPAGLSLPPNLHMLPGAGVKTTDECTDARAQAVLASGLRFDLGIDSFFGASHAIRPSGERHTHSFRVQASFISDTVDENGMIWGFREISNLLENEAKRFANRFLNDIEPFTLVQPTGENLAAVIFRNLAVATTDMMGSGPQLVHVTLWENPTSYVRVGRGTAA